MIPERCQQAIDMARIVVSPARRWTLRAMIVMVTWLAIGLSASTTHSVFAQTEANRESASDGLKLERLQEPSGDETNLESLSAQEGEVGAEAAAGAVAKNDANPAKRELNLLTLLFQGGWLMLPLALMAVLLVMLVIERMFALRRARIIPADLVEELGDLGAVPGVLDPRRAYRLCQEHPSPAATAIRTMLLKIGRPQTEIEHAVAETNEREADRLYASVRWLNLMTAVAPLIGLLGTVWGMIWAFYETTQMAPGTNKAEHLAEGIYIALVTTLGGLTVAIPAAIFSHYFEARIIRLFHEIDELLFNLLPQVERFEGRLRTTPHSLGGPDEEKKSGSVDPPDGTRRDPAHVR